MDKGFYQVNDCTNLIWNVIIYMSANITNILRLTSVGLAHACSNHLSIRSFSLLLFTILEL